MLIRNPGCEWEFERREEKFSEMAKKGCILVKYRRFFSTYEKDAPLETRYKILLEKDKPNEEQEDEYRKKGWVFVDHLESFTVYRAWSIDTPDLYMTRDELILNAKKVNKSNLINFWLVAFFTALLTGFLLRDLIIPGKHLADIINSRKSGIDVLLPYAVMVLFYLIRIRHTSKILKNLYAGDAENDYLSKQVKKKKMLFCTINDWCLRIAYFMLFIMTYVCLYHNDMHYESPSHVPVEMITLSEIETSPDFKPYGREHIELTPSNRNAYEPRDHILTRQLFIYSEGSSTESGVPQKSSYMPTLEVKYYNFWFHNLADILMKQEVKKAESSGYKELAKEKTSEYDSINVYKKDDSSYLLILTERNNEVMIIQYSGEEDYTRIIEVLDQRAERLD